MFLRQQLKERYTRKYVFLPINNFLNKKNTLWGNSGVIVLTKTMDSGEETEVTPQGKCIQGTIHMWIVEKETDGRNTQSVIRSS